MNVYDFTFLLKDKEELNNLKTLVGEVKGTLVSEEEWGKRQLAYPIKKLNEADFYNWRLELDEANVVQLRKKLQFNEQLLRYLLLKVDMRPKRRAKSRTKAQ